MSNSIGFNVGHGGGHYPGYPPQQQAGYPPNQAAGYPPNQAAGYPPQGAQPYPGYPPQQSAAHHHPGAYSGQPFPAPVQQQPTQNYAAPLIPGGWLSSNYYSYLQHASSFHVKQQKELIEAILGWESPNKYTVKDQAGHKIFYVGEESNLCGRQCCNARRAFTLKVKDGAGQDVLIMDRELDCSCCCGLFCPDEMTVSTPNGQKLGSVKEAAHLLSPEFLIRDAANNTVLTIEGPMCPMAFGPCTGSIVFRVKNQSGQSVGTISKEWSGFVRELFTDADYFNISFPPDLDPAIKAVCMGALFLIDYEYFEKGATDNHQGGRRLFG